MTAHTETPPPRPVTCLDPVGVGVRWISAAEWIARDKANRG